MRRGALLVLLLAALGAGAAGCGVGSGASTGDVTLSVTRDFGSNGLQPTREGGAHEGDTVMRLLQRDANVETRYGGGFVQEIDGVSGGREGGRKVDWFYYVNGIEAETGAAQRKVHPGDRILWDHHDWGAAMRIPAIVGAFPEPFVDGSDGKKIPVRLVCASRDQRSCDEVQTRLENAGVKGIARATLAQSGGKEVLRVIVGRWADVRGDGVARYLEEGPGASGVFARPDASGRSIALLDSRGRAVRRLGAGGGLVAAARGVQQQPTWLVTGTDDVGVAAAAAALTEDQLRNRFALAVDAGRPIPLPLTSAGDAP